MVTERERLSEAGERRRVEMLGELQGELTRVKRARARREVVGGVGVAIVACMAVGVALNSLRTGATSPVAPARPVAAHGASGETTVASAPASASPAPSAVPAITIAIVETDHNALRRYGARPQMNNLEILSDDQLLRELRVAGRDCGLVKMEGRAWLTCDGGS